MMTNKQTNCCTILDLRLILASEINEHLKTDEGLLTELFLIVLISHGVAHCEIFCVNKHEEGDT